jgi:hypothetical protein
MAIKIFVGTSKNGEDTQAEMALSYSLNFHSSVPLDIHFMRNTDDPQNPVGGFKDYTWWTPFTNLRWAIPEVCDFKGRAIYMDVDQLNFRDINDLYTMDLHGAPLACRKDRTCVIVFDNEKMKEHLLPISQIRERPNYGNEIYKKMCALACPMDPRWNCLDGEKRPISDIWHLHFTRMETQPWKPAWGFEKGIKHFEHDRKDLVSAWYYFRNEALGRAT